MAQTRKPQGITATATKVCSWFFFFKNTFILILVSIGCLIAGLWLRKSKFVKQTATATGVYQTDPKKNLTKYEIEYMVGDKMYTSFEQFDYRLKDSDKADVYVNVETPTMLFTSDPNKISRNCLIVSFISTILFIVAFLAALKYPTYFCAGNIFYQASNSLKLV